VAATDIIVIAIAQGACYNAVLAMSTTDQRA